MKKFCLLLSLLAFSFAGFSQTNFSVLKKHAENGTTLMRVAVENPLTPDEAGNYHLKLKSPMPFTSFAIGWDASSRSVGEGSFIVYYRSSQGGKWTDWQDDHG
ncbi:MAG: hypothetical protein HUK15_00310, partial [Bacteroidales bacterium]|nr:hypothetical protein [Bacteroidales bacterium]